MTARSQEKTLLKIQCRTRIHVILTEMFVCQVDISFVFAKFNYFQTRTANVYIVYDNYKIYRDNIFPNNLLYTLLPCPCHCYIQLHISGSKLFDLNITTSYDNITLLMTMRSSCLNLIKHQDRHIKVIRLLFCKGGIFSAHALTLVGTKLTPYISVALKFISLILQVSDTQNSFKLYFRQTHYCKH